MTIPDNYDVWSAHETQLEHRRKNLPVCDYCGEEIQDDFYYCVEGYSYCEGCMQKHFRRLVEVE